MPTQNVVVLGGAYAGAHAFRLLANGLGEEYRVILIDRNTHANFVYIFSRYAVLPGHEHKAFIPYKGLVHPVKASDPDPPPNPHHVVLHAKIVDLTPHAVTIDRTYPELGFDSPVIPFKYAVYALGSRLPASIDLWSENENAIAIQSHPLFDKPEDVEWEEEEKKGKEYDGTKQEAIEWFRQCQERIRSAGSILCVGGGALGIQFATDIKSLYPEKQVTLLHSRQRLLPRFDYELHIEVLKDIEDLGIDLILGERLDLESTRPDKIKYNERGQRVVRTEKGREIAADLILLCTGQLPNTDLLAKMSPQSVDPKTKLACVLRTMQLRIIPSSPSPPSSEDPSKSLTQNMDELSVTDSNSMKPETKTEAETETRTETETTPFPHIFVAGDCADAFGAIKAGHTAFWQAEVAAKNIIRLAQRDALAKSNTTTRLVNNAKEKEKEEQLGLGLETYTPGPPAIKVSLGIGRCSAYQINGMVGRKDTPEPDALDAPRAWAFFGVEDAREEDMFA